MNTNDPTETINEVNTSDPTSLLEMVITRVFDAPRSLVYEVWTQPGHIVNWMAPHGFTIPETSGELKVGGEWHCVMVAPDGTKHPLSGTYREVIPEELLVTTHCWEDEQGNPEHETTLAVRFADEDGKTRVTLEQRNFKSEASRDGHIDGWGQSLDRLTTLLETHPPVVVERLFDAPVSKVWQALTDKESFKHWYFDLAEFRPEVGFEFEFDAGEKGKTFLHHCRITSVIPEKELAYTWRYVGHEGDSLVTFSLFPEGEKTRLRVTHSGLETFPPIQDFARANFAMGWTDIVGKGLKEYVEK